jgi:hypothetical protein
MTEVENTILKFRNYVIQQSRSNLTKGKKNVTRKLYDSIKGEIVTENGFTIVGFKMDEYGSYQDLGVKGADPSQVSKNSKIRGQQAPNSPYKFKRRIPSAPFEKWARFRGVRFRNAKGEFAKGGYKSIGYIIAKNVWARGIKPSLFFTKPFEAGYKKYIDIDLVKSFGQDVETIVDYNLIPKK